MAPARRRATPTNPTNAELTANNAELNAMLTRLLQQMRNGGGDREDLIEESRMVSEAGGMYGYNSDRPLSEEEQAFHHLLMSMGTGMSSETADELFCQGINSTKRILRMPTDKLKHIVQNTAKNKSPSCPEPHKVFLGSAFEDDMQSIISYLGSDWCGLLRRCLEC